MKQYLDLCQRVVDTGHWVYNARTGKRCLTVINADLEYDCSKGKMPVLTTKKMFWKPAIAEMLGYLRGYSSAAQFRELGCNTWNANANENEAWLANPHRKGTDDMGRAYRFRASGYYTNSITLHKEKPIEQVLKRVHERVQPDMSSDVHKIVGVSFDTNNSGGLIVIKEYPLENTNRLVFDVQFEVSGYIKRGVLKADILRGEIKDMYAPSCAGIACLGDTSMFDDTLLTMLKPVWRNMIGRCYEKKSSRAAWYGDEGVFVCDRWLVFANFVEDCAALPNWELKQCFPKEYSLDKDWVNANYYSKETCRWASKKEQSVNSRGTNAFTARNINTDVTVLAKGAVDFGNEYNLPKNFAANVIGKYGIGETFVYHRWEITKVAPSSISYTEVDAFKEIYAKLRLGIDDRRLIMTAYQPHSRQQECLPACVHTHTFSVLDGTLYLTSFQRSDDLPLGHGFNQVQVAWLLRIMAQITGLKPGIAYHKVINAHIYEDQIEPLMLQLERTPYESPTMIINHKIKTLQDLETWVTVGDFEMFDYEHHPAIKFEFSV